ncbi:MAG TPA: hypothetical protein VJT82_12095 [Pyrinomonadaceae bacterium]|nr:hypothetical protein [Pyrinomonadaceae bacterium]
MKLRLCSLVVALCAFAPFALSNIPDPSWSKPRKEKPLPASRMVIESRGDVREARLQIPRGMYKQLRAEIDADSNPQPAASTAGLRSTRTIIAGVFLSLSLAFAGVFVVRTRSRATKQIALVALVFFGVAGAFAFKSLANAGPPYPRLLDAGTLSNATTPGAALDGAVRVEIVDEGSEIKLVVPAKETGSR